MEIDLAQIIGSILTFVVGVAMAIVAWRRTKSQVEKEGDAAANLVIESAVALLEPMKQGMERMGNELRHHQAKIDSQDKVIARLNAKVERYILVIRQLTSGVSLLSTQIESMGEKPIFQVPVEILEMLQEEDNSEDGDG